MSVKRLGVGRSLIGGCRRPGNGAQRSGEGGWEYEKSEEGMVRVRPSTVAWLDRLTIVVFIL